MRALIAATVLLAGLCTSARLSADDSWLTLSGEPRQGSLMFGRLDRPGQVSLDGIPVMVTPEGRFVIGFGRDETGTRTLSISFADGSELSRNLKVASREYQIERIDGLPPSTVSPPAEVTQRIRRETAQIVQARKRRDNRSNYDAGFIWPAQGRLSGFYGSQRILNGQPRRPHYGLDIAAAEGACVVAPAAGLITLAHADMYYSGGTIILDHGQGLSSAFLHLSQVDVEAGQWVEQGELIGRIGATGRATGPHLDWRINWLDRRVDPLPLLPPQQEAEPEG